MTVFLRLGGLALIIVCAGIIGREYSSFVDRRLAEYAAFSALLLHIERRIDLSLSYGSELWRGFDDSRLEQCGFLRLLKEGREPAAAFAECRKKLALPDKTSDLLYGFFSDFGRDYREGELKRLSAVRSELDTQRAADETELEKNKKVVNALLVGGAASAAILLI